MANTPQLPTAKDNRGAEITIGCRVAYNMSGQIAVGIVFDIIRSRRNGRSGLLFKIEPEYPVWARRQTESKVHDPSSILVLEATPEQKSAILDLIAGKKPLDPSI